MSEPIVDLKTRLRQALELRGIKPIELSEATNIPKSAISQYMSGYTKPKQDRIYAIAKVLNVSEAWLMGYDVPMEKFSIKSDSLNNKPINEEQSEEIILLNRAAKKMTPEKRKKLLEMAKVMFEEDFADDD